MLALLIFAPKSVTHQLRYKDKQTPEKLSNQQLGQRLQNTLLGPTRPITASALTAQLPLTFQPNHGQADAAVKFLSRGPGYQLFLTATQAVFSLRPAATAATAQSPGQIANDKAKPRAASSDLRLTLKNANAQARVKAADRLPGVENYF
ncbi:MAG TPA: hypothetical protein VGO73_11125, partial [Pyrinomonadaceae bacterium]|nr:hypothetical protein [Pyrinomonadaceae bacterium]